MLKVSHHLTKFSIHRHCGIGDIINISPILKILYIGVLLAKKGSCEPIKIIHHAAKFGAHMHSSSGDIMVFASHVTLQDHVIKESCDFMSRSPIKQVNLSLSLVVIDTTVVEL